MTNDDDVAREARSVSVEAIHRGQAMLLLSNGERGWVTDWFDGEGKACNAADAISCVGTDDYGAWYVVDLREFENVFSH